MIDLNRGRGIGQHWACGSSPSLLVATGHYWLVLVEELPAPGSSAALVVGAGGPVRRPWTLPETVV